MILAIRIRALLFARLREQAGTDREELDLPLAASAATAYAELRRRHPALEGRVELIRPALNQEFCDWSQALREGDEVAFILPVSGGGGDPAAHRPAFVELTAEVLDARRLEAAVAHPGAGAICTFTGVVRNNSRGRATRRLEYEAYGEMAVKQMNAIALEIGEKWPEARVAFAHRTGVLEIGEASVVVSVSSPHRAEAIAACQWGIDRLKESVPIWKKEFFGGGEVWVEGEDHLTP